MDIWNSHENWEWNGNRNHMPSLQQIVSYWSGLENLYNIFPLLKSSWIGWGEPFCFKCGWLAPGDLYVYEDWRGARGWLQRAHLRDASCGGSNDLFNLVPLCDLCHTLQPSCLSTEKGIAYINLMEIDGNRIPEKWGSWWQGYTDSLDIDLDRPHITKIMTKQYKEMLISMDHYIKLRAEMTFEDALVELDADIHMQAAAVFFELSTVMN